MDSIKKLARHYLCLNSVKDFMCVGHHSTITEGVCHERDKTIDEIIEGEIFDIVMKNIPETYNTNPLKKDWEWFNGIETKYGKIAYIDDNYPSFYISKENYNKIKSCYSLKIEMVLRKPVKSHSLEGL